MTCPVDYLNLTDEQKAKLRSLMPVRVILELNTNNGAPEIRALCEESFSMNFYTNRAQVYWSSPNATSNVGGSFNINGVEWARGNHKKYMLEQMIFDPLAEDCPVQINWQTWLEDQTDPNASKFNKRNARFAVKPQGLWQMRALIAEARYQQHDQELVLLRDSHSKLEATIDSIKAIINPSVGDDE